MAGDDKSGIFAFDDFKLDSDKLMLYRDGVEVSIPPKVAKTLAVLVESAGTIIPKDDVIARVWDDSIVEESNLTQYLYLLRKILGNMPDGRPYIETLRRRGYRFNGKVERVIDETTGPATRPRPRPETAVQFGGVEREGNVLRLVDWKSVEEPVEAVEASVATQATTIVAATKRQSWIPGLAVAAIVLLATGGGAFFFFFWPKYMPAATTAKSQQELAVIRLTNGYAPAGATISPDGNVFVYHEFDGDVSRIFVQQSGQPSRIEITSSNSLVYSVKTFSPDGQSVFFVATDKKSRMDSVYRIPTMGGSPVKILEDIYGAISFSPDGKEMTFCRRNPASGDSSLWIANSDGRAERLIIQRSKSKSLLPSPSWSPDGKLIAYAERDVYGGMSVPTQRVNLLDIATGKSTPLSAEDWAGVYRIIWAYDGGGIFTLATRDGDSYSTRRDQLYFTSYPAGVSQRLTNEGNRHQPESLGVTRKGEVFGVSADRLCQLWVMDANGRASTAVQLTKGTADGRAGIGILPDGRIAYLTRNADEIPIMLAGADGESPTQIASGFPFVEELRADPQGRFFIFSTMKDGKHRLFRMYIDGSNLQQLTFGDGNSIDSSISPDGKFLVYDSSPEGNDASSFSIMRIPTEGGEPVTLKKGCFIPTYSPDGSMISCISSTKPEFIIISATDGAEIERHPLPLFATWNFGVGWTTDGAGLVYIATEKGTSNLWIQARDGSKPRPLTNFTSGSIFRYVFSPDGSKIYIARGYPTHYAFLIRNFR